MDSDRKTNKGQHILHPSSILSTSSVPASTHPCISFQSSQSSDSRMDPLGPAAWRIAQHRNLINQRVQQMEIAQRVRKEHRQEKIRERVRRIKIIQDYDRQVDKALLYHAPLPIQTPRPQARPWFISRDMSGDPGYVLQWLSALVRASLPDDTLLDKIDNWFDNWRWQTNPFQKHCNVSLLVVREVPSLTLR